jgi:ATP-dependent DNA helicase RecG
VKSQWLEGTIPQMLVKARDVVKVHIREFQRLGPDNKFFRGPEYPEDAWHEAIVNACIHRSFNMKNTSVFVKMFDDRLEIESPGGFPPGITPENIYRHSHPRNRRLAEALVYLSYVRCENEGTRRMRDTMKGCGLPEPIFTQSDVDGIKVKVVLRNNVALRKQYVDQRAVDAIGSQLFSTLTDRERTIVNFTAEHGKITVSDASRIARGGWQHVKNILDSMAQRGVMSRISPMGIERDPKAHYVLKTNRTGQSE